MPYNLRKRKKSQQIEDGSKRIKKKRIPTERAVDVPMEDVIQLDASIPIDRVVPMNEISQLVGCSIELERIRDNIFQAHLPVIRLPANPADVELQNNDHRAQNYPQKHAKVNEDLDCSPQTSQIKDKKSDEQTKNCSTRRPKREVKTLRHFEMTTNENKLKCSYRELMKNIQSNSYLKDKNKCIEFLKDSEERFHKDSELNKLVSSDNLFELGTYSFTGYQFISLACKDEEVDGAILDSIMFRHCQQSVHSPSIQYIPTMYSAWLEKDPTAVSPFNKNKKFIISIYNQQLKNGSHHWILFVLDKSNRYLYVMDPLKHSDENALGNKLLRWVAQVPKDKDETNFSDNNQNNWNFDAGWKIKTIIHSRQADNTSCGLFCLEFGIKFIEKYNKIPSRILVNSTEDNLRKKHVATLLNAATFLNNATDNQ